jgi:formylglycine-generating enzyme required for sulfatase activity
MVSLPGGTFLMGTEDGQGFAADGEGPVRKVRVKPFLIDRCATTNTEFARFVDETGYRTDAERFGWSFVFHLFVAPRARGRVRGVAGGAPWWRAVQGASWKAPEGFGSTLEGREDHPAVHVSHADALAYCSWAGRRLPFKPPRAAYSHSASVGRRLPAQEQ